MVNNDIEDRRPATRWDDRVLGVLMMALGGLRVGIAIDDNERWGAEASIAAIMTVLGLFLVFFPIRWRK